MRKRNYLMTSSFSVWTPRVFSSSLFILLIVTEPQSDADRHASWRWSETVAELFTWAMTETGKTAVWEKNHLSLCSVSENLYCCELKQHCWSRRRLRERRCIRVSSVGQDWTTSTAGHGRITRLETWMSGGDEWWDSVTEWTSGRSHDVTLPRLPLQH